MGTLEGNFRAALTPSATSVQTQLKTYNKPASVTPNPAYSDLHIHYRAEQSEQVEMWLVNALGQRVMTIDDSVHAPGDCSLHVPINHLPNGIYFLIIQTPRGRFSRQIGVLR